jgi:hypothetical protein
MSDFQKGLDNIVAEIRRELSARYLGVARVSPQLLGSALDGAQITVVALGKTTSATFDRKEIDECHYGVTVDVQVKIKHFVGKFEC